MQRCAARLDKLCMCLRHVLVRRQVTREQAGQRAYAELQSKHQATPPALQFVRHLCWRDAACGAERRVGRLVIVARSG